MFDETFLCTLHFYIHYLEEYPPPAERIFDIIHTISDDQIPIIENASVRYHNQHYFFLYIADLLSVLCIRMEYEGTFL